MHERGLFLPGFGARAAAYAPGLPDGWRCFEPPSFRSSGGGIDAYVRRLLAELDSRRETVVLAGHSMGAAVALLAAAERVELVSALVLVSPAGLPLVKPLASSATAFVSQAGGGRFRGAPLARPLADVLRAPRSALRVARAIRALDLTEQMAALRERRVAATVIGCVSDTLVTVEHARRMAGALGARYREIELDGGHTWMFEAWPRFSRELQSGADVSLP